jgi:XTP/dITP diphosphohydrolase
MPPIPILLAGTANAHKLAEIAAILSDLPLRVVGASVLRDQHEVPEDGETFLANARAKALEFARRAALIAAPSRPRWALADDSGLCVSALGGAPGVRSARYSGEGSTSARNNEKLLQALAAVPSERRQARFVCALACAEVPRGPVGEPRLLFDVEGACEGRIGFEPCGSEGFGYDPLFVEATTGLTFAEMPAFQKNRLSHRARALDRFREKLLQLLAGS